MIGSKADLSRLLGVHASMVTKHIKRGTVTVRPDGKIDLDLAVKSVKANTDPTRGGPNGVPLWQRSRLKTAAQEAATRAAIEPDDVSAEPVPAVVERTMQAFTTSRIPLLPAAPGEEGLVESVEADAALAEQRFDLPEFTPRDRLQAIVHGATLRLAAEQLAIHTEARWTIHAAAGDEDALHKALGSMFGKLRHALDVERNRLIAELSRMAKERKP